MIFGVTIVSPPLKQLYRLAFLCLPWSQIKKNHQVYVKPVTRRVARGIDGLFPGRDLVGAAREGACKLSEEAAWKEREKKSESNLSIYLSLNPFCPFNGGPRVGAVMSRVLCHRAPPGLCRLRVPGSGLWRVSGDRGRIGQMTAAQDGSVKGC